MSRMVIRARPLKTPAASYISIGLGPDPGSKHSDRRFPGFTAEKQFG
jgi:hypothetical protein